MEDFNIGEFYVEFGFICPVKKTSSAWVSHSSGEGMMINEEHAIEIKNKINNMPYDEQVKCFEEWYYENF